MGHIRLGRLPKTKPWAGVFDVLKSEVIHPSELAGAVAVGAEQQFASFENNAGINYCFWILVRVVTASRSEDFTKELAKLGVRSTELISGLAFVQRISQTVERETKKRSEPTVFLRIAELSLREVLSANIIEQSKSLFGTGVEEIQKACRAISTQKRFGQIAREYFSTFTNRSIQYIADKELSNYVGPDKSLKSPKQALEFQQTLNRYCFESAKIVEDFAAGWFSKHNWESNNNISEEATAGFTSYALHKIQMELREGRV